MKLLLAVLVLAAYVIAEEETVQNADQIEKECLEEHPLSDEQASRINEENIFPDQEEPCQLLLCILKKSGSFETGKGFNVDRLVKKFQLNREKEERATRLIQDCINQHYKHDKNDAKNAYDVFHCYQNKSQVVSEEETVQNMDQIKKECLEKNSLEDRPKHMIDNENSIPKEEVAMQFLICMLTKNASFETGKGFNVDRIVKEFKLDEQKEAIATDLVRDCIRQHYKCNKREGETVRATFACFQKLV